MPTSPAETFDSLLDGLAIFNAYTAGDSEALEALANVVSPTAALKSTLQVVEMLDEISVRNPDVTPDDARSALRARFLVERARHAAA